MKRILVSIIVGVGCSLITFALIQIFKNRSKSYSSTGVLYNGELRIKIGSDSDDKRSVTTTLGQIKNRIDFIAGASVKQSDKNQFLISIKRIADSGSTKKLVSESIDLEFSETFLINEIADAIKEVEDELARRRKKINGSSDSSDKYEFLLEEVDLESKKKNGTCPLTQLISFSSSVEDVSGKVRFPSALGQVKPGDTIYLNNLLKDQEIKNKFPPELVFAYGTQTFNSKYIDSSLNIYAIKVTDPKLYPLPTGANIKDCLVDFDPLTGSPLILFAFDGEGSNYWYTMTKRNTGKPIAILINGFVLTAPTVEEAIVGGESRIMGNFTIEEATYLSSMLRTGRLALPVAIIESKFEPAKKSLGTFWMLGLVFLVSSLLAYSISLLIKPNSKP